MFQVLCQVVLLLIANVSAEAISVESIAAFETPGTWQAVYEPWHHRAVESHKSFFSKTHANEGDAYAPFSPHMKLSSSATWVSSLEVLPDRLDGYARTTDLLTIMMIDLDYHKFDAQTASAINVQLAATQKTKEDWVNVASESTGNSRYGVQSLFRDVFQDASNQYEFLIGYKNEKPVVTAVVFYEGNYASVYWVSTIPSERRQGFGTTLMINALERVRRRNIRWVVLQAQPLGEGIYRSLGFLPAGYLARY